jgi:aromatic-L-amino-acid decarboxylase
MDWAASLLGLDDTFHVKSSKGGGALQGTASDSGLLAGIAARIRFQTARPDVPAEKLILYISSQTHSLGVKTAMLLGLKCRILQVLAEDDYSLRGSTLKAAYNEDRAAGLWPFCLSTRIGLFPLEAQSYHPAVISCYGWNYFIGCCRSTRRVRSAR